MDFILYAVLLGLIPGYIAQGKGKSFGAWWAYGAAIFIVALPHALMLKPDASAIEAKQRSEGMKKCPSCAEMVKTDANICRYCGNSV